MAKKGYYYGKKNTRPVLRFRIKAVFFIVFLVFCACFIIYMFEANITTKKINSQGFSADSFAVEASSETETMTDSDSQASAQIINPVPASDPLTETYFGKCAFVGDSLTVGLADYQLVPSANVFAALGMNIEKINTEPISTSYGKMTISQALLEAKPENIYIMLGSNGIAWLSNEEMIDYYSEFVDEIKEALPDSKIYILSIPPVTEEREQAEDEPVSNSDIDDYNSKLLELANKKSVYYVDINTTLKGNDGKFPADMAESDGMHFVKSTYTKMLEYILSHTAK